MTQDLQQFLSVMREAYEEGQKQDATLKSVLKLIEEKVEWAVVPTN